MARAALRRDLRRGCALIAVKASVMSFTVASLSTCQCDTAGAWTCVEEGARQA